MFVFFRWREQERDVEAADERRREGKENEVVEVKVSSIFLFFFHFLAK